MSAVVAPAWFQIISLLNVFYSHVELFLKCLRHSCSTRRLLKPHLKILRHCSWCVSSHLLLIFVLLLAPAERLSLHYHQTVQSLSPHLEDVIVNIFYFRTSAFVEKAFCVTQAWPRMPQLLLKKFVKGLH